MTDTAIDNHDTSDDGGQAAGPGHNQPTKFADLSPAEMRSLKLKAGNLVRDLGDLALKRASLNADMSAIRGALNEMGFNKKAIKHAEAMENMRRAENTAPLDGYFASLRILSAAINVPIDADGQFGLLFDEPAGEPEPGLTETRAGDATHFPAAPRPARTKRRKKDDPDAPVMDGSAGPGSGRDVPRAAPTAAGAPAKMVAARVGDVDLQYPLVPDTIAAPRGVKEIDFVDAVSRGRVAFRRGVERRAPDEFAGELGDVWERAWDYEQALQGEGPANAAQA